jgi:hypothetical protein
MDPLGQSRKRRASSQLDSLRTQISEKDVEDESSSDGETDEEDLEKGRERKKSKSKLAARGPRLMVIQLIRLQLCPSPDSLRITRD